MLARMTSKGQVTVPREVRRELKLRKGTLISFVLREDGTGAEIAAVEDDVMALKGSVRVKGPQDYGAIQAEVEERIARDVADEA